MGKGGIRLAEQASPFEVEPDWSKPADAAPAGVGSSAQGLSGAEAAHPPVPRRPMLAVTAGVQGPAKIVPFQVAIFLGFLQP
jgi:hypothetical protein